LKHAGQAWRQEADAVTGHDFLSASLGRVSPSGLVNGERNEGAVYGGMAADPPDFAVDVLSRWGHDQGRLASPQATRLLLGAEGGGSHGSRPRLWKAQLQSQRSDVTGRSLTGCPYPPGCSKWTPLAHRLCRHLSITWAGQPLRTRETMLSLIRGPTTQTGLQVSAHGLEGLFETRKKVSDAVMKTLHCVRHTTCPRWNYPIRPRLDSAPTR
jgi:hypothetical protein